MFNASSARHSFRVLSCAGIASLLLASCGGEGGSSTDPALASGASAETVNAAESSFVAGAGTQAATPATPASPSSDTTAAPATPAKKPSTSTTTDTSTTSNTPTTSDTSTSSNTPTTSTTSTTPTTSTNTGTSTTPSAPTQTAAAPGPYGQDASLYTQTFADEFNGNSLNTSVWNDAIWYEGSNATKNYAVENGSLKIWPQRDASGNFFNRTIDTDGKYYQTYGFFEMEAKLPNGKGTWPAFWLFNHDGGGNYRPEIDILEAYSGGGPNSGWSDSALHPTAYAGTVWVNGIANGGGMSKTFQNLGDLSAGFHKYGLKWEPNKITFYYDGKEMYSANASMGERMYILLDLWFGSASGDPDGSTPTGKSNAYEVNYVRGWKLK